MGDWTDHITVFLLGVLKNVDENNPEKSVIVPFTKVGTGYSVDELQELRNKLRTKWKKFDPKSKPSYFASWNPSTIDNPDVYISNPADSIILEVKAAEFIRTNTFAADYTLRFPRVVKIRYDKDWYEGLSETEMDNMIRQVSQNKGLRNLKRKGDNLDSDEEENPKSGTESNKEMIEIDDKGTKRKWKKPVLESNVYSQFRDTDTSKVEPVSILFENCEFYVANVDNNVTTKHFLEENIVRYGGTKVQNFQSTNTHVIASVLDYKVKAILNKYELNIFKPEWVLDSIKKNELQEMAPKYMIYVMPIIKGRVESYFDKYGDHYFKYSTPDDVRLLLKEVTYNLGEMFLDDDLIEIKNELKANLIQDSHPFRDKIFFQISQDQSADDKFLKAMVIKPKKILFKICSRGGIVKDKLMPETRYIIKSSFNEEQKKVIDRFLANHKNCKIVAKKELFGLI